MNKAIIVGNLTRDPEGGITQSGTSWCRFTVACNRKHTNADGQRDADFIPVVAWGKTAENCVQYLGRGRKVGVDGRIETRSYDDNGTKKYITEVIAETVEFLSANNINR